MGAGAKNKKENDLELEENNRENQGKVVEETSDPRIDAIKDIIFGENIKEYDAEFKKIKEYIEEQKSILETAIDSLRSDMDKLLEEVRNDFDDSVKSLKNRTLEEMNNLDDTKANRATLGSMLEDIGKKLQE